MDSTDHTPQQAHLPEDPALKYLGEALKTSFAIFKVLMLVVLVVFLCSGVFTVGQNERGLVLRFGKFVGREIVRKPGLYWAWPYPIDTRVVVPVGSVQTVRTWAFWPQQNREQQIEGKATPLPEGQIIPGEDGINFTGDNYIVHTIWSARYKVNDPVAYVRMLADPNEGGIEEGQKKIKTLVREGLQNAVIKVVGHFGVDDVLRTNKAKITEEVEKELVAFFESLKAGLTIEGVVLERAEPPGRLKKAFDSVVKANLVSSKLKEEANGYKARAKSEAAGKAARTQAEADAYRVSVVETAAGDAKYMRELLAKCREKNGKIDDAKLDLYLNGLRLRAVSEFLAAADEKFVLRPKGPKDKRQLRLRISRDPEAAKKRPKTKAPEDEDPAAHMAPED